MVTLRLRGTVAEPHLLVLRDLVLRGRHPVDVVPVHEVLRVVLPGHLVVALRTDVQVHVHCVIVDVVRVVVSVIYFLGWLEDGIVGHLLKANQILVLGLVVHMPRQGTVLPLWEPLALVTVDLWRLVRFFECVLRHARRQLFQFIHFLLLSLVDWR